MPEGDTIFRTAARLRPLLVGQAITAADSRLPGWPADTLPGCTVAAVEPRGKHLLMHLDDRRAIHSHLGMHGSWHIYAPGMPWQRPPRQAALRLEVPATVCVCFSPQTLELLTEAGLRRHPHLTQLGTDLLAEEFDAAEAVRRFRVHNARPIGEAVMDQTIACGIGNIYKSEVLFLCRLNPLLLVGALDDQQLQQLIQRARELMSQNLTNSARQTRFALDRGRFWVYGRSGRPCFRCGQRIRIRRQGDLGRTTYWCPRCQSPPTASKPTL